MKSFLNQSAKTQYSRGCCTNWKQFNSIQFNQRFYKQIDGCKMGGPLSVILADINMVRTEKWSSKTNEPSVI